MGLLSRLRTIGHAAPVEVAKSHPLVELTLKCESGYLSRTGLRATSNRDGSDREVTSVPDWWTSSRAGARAGSITPRGR
jgi:hypothetical protein